MNEKPTSPENTTQPNINSENLADLGVLEFLKRGNGNFTAIPEELMSMGTPSAASKNLDQTSVLDFLKNSEGKFTVFTDDSLMNLELPLEKRQKHMQIFMEELRAQSVNAVDIKMEPSKPEDMAGLPAVNDLSDKISKSRQTPEASTPEVKSAKPI